MMSCILTDKSGDGVTEKPAVRTVQWLARVVGVATAAYAAYAGWTWLRYGHAKDADGARHTLLLHRIMPTYEVADSHSVHAFAPPEICFVALSNVGLMHSGMVRAIFKLRELILGSKPDEPVLNAGLLEQAKAIGWELLAEETNREVVFGAVTRPWEANVVFRGLPAAEFAAFNEPGYVKIAWTLRAEPLNSTESMLRTETRVSTTDKSARRKFRVYWAAFSPGIILIRKVLLRSAKKEAELSWHSPRCSQLLADLASMQRK